MNSLGRLYPNRAFFHEQGDDVAKSMLLHANGSQLGEEGLYWLFVHGSNTWGNDKVSLDDRVAFIEERYEEILSFSRDPYNNTGWMDADKPLSYLAFCKEVQLLNDWVEAGNQQEEFVTNLVCYVDGSTNG